MLNIKIHLLIFLFVGVILFSCGFFEKDIPKEKKILDLKPDKFSGKDVSICSRSTSNLGDIEWMQNMAWVGYGDEYWRSLIEFIDIKKVSKHAVVDSATLVLHYGDSYHLDGSVGENQCQIHLVTENWDEYTINWKNQPSYSLDHSVVIDTNNDFDSIKVDVTNLIQLSISNAEMYHGFLIKLVNEDPICSMVFYSSDRKDQTKHPKLTVYYKE